MATKTRFRLFHVKTGAERRFDKFTDAVDELAKLPGNWGAFWSGHALCKGEHLVDEVVEDKCETQPGEPSKPPQPPSPPPASS